MARDDMMRTRDVEDADDHDWGMDALQHTAPRSPRPRSRVDAVPSLTPLARVVFVVVLALLAAGLFVRLSDTRTPADVSTLQPPLRSGSAPSAVVPPPPPTPLRPLDAPAQAYLGVLQTYYQPLYADLTASDICESAYAQAAPANRVKVLFSCRDADAAVVTAASTLAGHLATAVPPPRWQSAHVGLVQAVRATIPAYQQRLVAIDTQRPIQFDQTALNSTVVLVRYCAPLADINLELPAESTLTPPNGVCSLPSDVIGG
jgi:hypothetical protein